MRQKEGLWEFPLFDTMPQGTLTEIGSCRHSITHHRIHVRVHEGRLGNRNGFRRVKFKDLPVTSLTRKIHAVAAATETRATTPS